MEQSHICFSGQTWKHYCCISSTFLTRKTRRAVKRDIAALIYWSVQCAILALRSVNDVWAKWSSSLTQCIYFTPPVPIPCLWDAERNGSSVKKYKICEGKIPIFNWHETWHIPIAIMRAFQGPATIESSEQSQISSTLMDLIAARPFQNGLVTRDM